MATIHRLRTRNRAHVEALRVVLDMEVWPEPLRVMLNERLSTFALHTGPDWNYAMIAIGTAKIGPFLQAIHQGPRPFATLAVWIALLSYVRIDTGEIIASQRTVAKTADVGAGDVSRAYKRLVEIGALINDGGGKYRVHPVFAWKGELAKRAEAEKRAPKLELVE